MRTLLSWSKLTLVALSVPVVATACGSDEGSAAPPGPNAGSAGSAGAGAAGRSGAGVGGAAAGSAGSAGKSGASGTTAGSGGANGCKVAADCAVIAVEPAGCAEAVCTNGACTYRAVDGDGDGQRTKLCQSTATPKVPVELGADCNDADPNVFPGAWDGPAADGKPDRCKDGVDQDCSGSDGDGKGSKGESCTCTPGDTQACDQTSDGKPITFPGGKPQGACSSGSRTCVVDAITKAAVFGPCTGAVAPEKEICNGGIDDDCDGFADMQDTDPPLNTSTWSYDGDGDGYVVGSNARTEWCADERPSTCPTGLATCDKLKWKLGNLPGPDCDDANENARPDAIEKCNADPTLPPVDLDCNGITNAPGAGDCQCRDGDVVACAPGDKSYPSGAVAPSDKYPLPATPDFQSGGLVGECRWGQKECVKGQWSGCHDGVGAKAAEDCSKTDMKDYDCNGVPNRNQDGTSTADCSCTGAQTQACGDCGKGTSVCSGGVFGPCGGDDVKVLYCADADGDAVCAGSCQLECPGANHDKRRLASSCFNGEKTVDCNDASSKVGQNVKETCGGIDEDCDGSPSNGFPDLGQACDNGLEGSCADAGKRVCNGTTSTKCDAVTYADAPNNSYASTKLHNSYDRNCDGVEEHEPPITLLATFASKARQRTEFGISSCNSINLSGVTGSPIYKACQAFAPGFPSGTGRVAGVLLCDEGVPIVAGVTAPNEAVAVDQLGRKTTTACGQPYLRVICDRDGQVGGADRIVQRCR